MNTQPDEPVSKSQNYPVARDAANWAKPVERLSLNNAPGSALNLNVDGRQTLSPLRGFGQLWQKTYQVRLKGAAVLPIEVVRVWKERFSEFQPPENRFYPSVAGVKPGEVVLINATTPGGLVSTGVMVMYSDDESFTLMTPQGHPESGWVTFSAFESDGCTIAQVQSLARANDPFYEIAFRLVGSSLQENIWRHVLISLAKHFEVNASVELTKSCIDPRLQWSEVGNIRHNAQILTLLYTMTSPVRKLLQRGKKEAGDG
jgi:hypothetical protein